MFVPAVRGIAGAAVATAVLSLAAPPALAHNGDDRVRRGSCSGATDWKVKVGPEDGRLEVEGEVDTNRAGQAWAWTIRHNGSVSARGTSTTTARSGSFEVERKIVDLAGTDRVVFRATYAGLTCRGVVNF